MKKVVNAIILNSAKKKILIIKRKEGIHSNKWAFPGGIIKKNETSKQALKREVKEELDLEIKKIIKKIGDYEYFRKNKEKTFGKSYLVSVENFRIKINPIEISKFKWTTMEELEKLDRIPDIDYEVMKALVESTK
ncbi:NUDIX hydrolase [Candidatus Pacearchaeota archaeon]|nr:NUDIX hydrolase [Candidatus Pacearchaeota archaeon]